MTSSAQSVKATRYADADAVIGMNNNVYGIPLSTRPSEYCRTVWVTTCFQSHPSCFWLHGRSYLACLPISFGSIFTLHVRRAPETHRVHVWPRWDRRLWSTSSILPSIPMSSSWCKVGPDAFTVTPVH